MPHYPDPVIKYRLASPGEDLVPDRYALTFASPQDAWRVAAQRTLDPDWPENPDSADRAKVARDLLDCNDTGTMWGWEVSRFADTLTHQEKVGMTLSREWSEALSLRNRGVLLGTYGKLAAAMVDDLIEDEMGVDLAVGTNATILIGVATKVDGTTVAFSDEVATDLNDTTFVLAIYR